MMSKGLYVHIPFCLSKCPYCDFYSVRYSAEKAALYAAAAKRSIEHYGYAYDTVYFGGGTPILLHSHIGALLDCARVDDGAEITVEANPCMASYEILRELKGHGVNRLSLGVQSMNESELRFLGRRHTPKQAESAVENAHKAGIDNISADIMLGLEGQDERSIENSISALDALGVTHISAYLLKIEEGTPFAGMSLSLPDDDRSAELYLFTVECLGKRGFTQYEISNFAREDSMCRHNLKYWRCEEYIGVGAAAHSYIGGKRFRVARDIDSFITSPLQETEVTDDSAGGFDEFAMLRLRLSDGLRFTDAERFGIECGTLIRQAESLPKDLVEVTESGISLTPRGFLVSNTVIGKILGYGIYNDRK